jgi:large subunit ribosomal protein L29
MKMSEIKDLTEAELAVKSNDLRQELFGLRLKQASSQLEQPAKLRLLRRDVARLETRRSQLRTAPKAT